MEFINNWYNNMLERKQVNYNEALKDEARTKYTIKEFQNTLFIAFEGVPIIGFQPETTVKEILERLHHLQENYVKYKS